MNVVVTPWFMYWFTRLDAINGLFHIFAVLGFIALFGIGFIFGLSSAMEGKDYFKKFKLWRWMISLTILATIGSIGMVLTPTTKEAATIFLVPAIANNEQVQKVPKNALNVLNEKLEQYLEDLKGTEKKEAE